MLSKHTSNNKNAECGAAKPRVQKLSSQMVCGDSRIFWSESIIEPVVENGNMQQLSYEASWRAQTMQLCFALRGVEWNKAIFLLTSNVRMSWSNLLSHSNKLLRIFTTWNFSGVPTTKNDQASLCWICETELNTSAKDPMVLDHCHFTGNFLRWAHAQCNLKCKTLNFTPVCPQFGKLRPSSFNTSNTKFEWEKYDFSGPKH